MACLKLNLGSLGSYAINSCFGSVEGDRLRGGGGRGGFGILIYSDPCHWALPQSDIWQLAS